MNPKQLTATALLLFALLSPVACSDEIVMPDVVGMTEGEASEALREAGLHNWTVRLAEGPKTMVVIQQNPSAGEPVDSATEVQINLSGE